jgi:hypothetical protein
VKLQWRRMQFSWHDSCALRGAEMATLADRVAQSPG